MHATRQDDSKAFIVCQQCGEMRYLDGDESTAISRYLNNPSERKLVNALSGAYIGWAAVHTLHNGKMYIEQFPDGTPAPLHVEDLCRVYIRTRDGQTLNCEECSDEQFDTWARSRMEIRGKPGPWNLEERVYFCDRLYRVGVLHMLKKGAL